MPWHRLSMGVCKLLLIGSCLYLARSLIACWRDYLQLSTYLVDSAVSWGERDKWWPTYGYSEQGNVPRQIKKYTRQVTGNSRVQQRTKLFEASWKWPVGGQKNRKSYNERTNIVHYPQFNNVLYRSSFTSHGHLAELIRAKGNHNSSLC